MNSDKIKKFFEDRNNLLAAVIVFFALSIRLKYAFFSGMWWDEGVYSYISGELFKHPLSFSTPIHGQIQIFSPFFIYLLTLSQLILGKGEFAVRIVNPIVSSIGVFIVYLLGSKLYNKKTGIIAAALLSVSPLFWFQNEKVLLETPETVFMTLAFLLIYIGIEENNKKILWLSGFVSGIAYLTRISAGFIIPITIMYLVATRKVTWVKNKDLWLAAIIGLLVLVPWIVRNMGVCNQPLCEIGRGVSSITPDKDPTTGETLSLLTNKFEYVKQLPFILSNGVFLFLLLGLLYALQARTKGDKLLLIWFFTFVLISTQLGSGRTLRRVLILIPPSILLASRAISNLSDQIKLKQISSAILAVLIVAPLMFYSIQSAQNDLIIPKAPAYAKLKDAGLYFKDMPHDTRIMTASVPLIAFYSSGKNISGYPKNETNFKEELENRDIDYVILDVYEALQPQWAFNVVPNTDYLELQKIIYENDIQDPNNFRVAIFKVNKEKL